MVLNGFAPLKDSIHSYLLCRKEKKKKKNKKKKKKKEGFLKQNET